MTTILSVSLVFTLLLLSYVFIQYQVLLDRIQSDYTHLQNLIEEDRTFSLKEEVFQLPESAVLGRLIAGVMDDYKDIRQKKRQFTENASHELQTPLAIIQGHAEILLQAPKLRKVDYEAIGAIMYQLKKVSRLNEALILLTKIEHNGFSSNTRMFIAQSVEEQLEDFEPLIKAKNIEIKKQLPLNISVEMNDALLEILLCNLFKNAIKYNVSRGYIRIVLNAYSLEITNSGYPLNQAAEQMFLRFKRDDSFQKEEGLGLGLSIVRRICDFYQHTIRYEHEAGTHRLIWVFN